MDQKIVRRFWSVMAAALTATALASPPAAHAELVRTVIPRSTVNYLSLPVADVKGFFRAEGLENETIVIPGTTAIAALVSGNVDYSGAGGTGMRAAMRGAPIKAVIFQTEKVTWYLLAAPDIQKISDLKGKRVAVGTVGDTQDTLITMLVEREGLTSRDITRVAMPSRNTMNTILSLKTGAFSAAVGATVRGSGSHRVGASFWHQERFLAPLGMTPMRSVIPNEERDLARTEPLPGAVGIEPRPR